MELTAAVANSLSLTQLQLAIYIGLRIKEERNEKHQTLI
jgi:hypothetical protein